MARFGGLAALLACLLLGGAAAAAEEPGIPFGPGVPLVAVGGPGPGGRVAVRPDGAGGYMVRTVVTPGDLTLAEYRARRIAGALIRGTCDRWRGAAPAPAPAADVLTEWQVKFGDVALPAPWTTGPLAFVLAADDGAGPVRACADVPFAGIEAFEPLPRRGPATAPLAAPAGAGYGGRVSVWPTPSGHLLVRVDLDDRSGNRIALAWTVAEGSCAAWAAGQPPPLVTDAGATRLIIDSDGRERRVPHRRQATVFLNRIGSWVGERGQWQALLVHERWPKGTAEGAVSVSAALPGGGVVCADLPVAAAGAAGGLPRTGSPPWWVAVVLGGGLLAAGAALRGRPEF